MGTHLRANCCTTRLSWAHTPVMSRLVVSSNPVKKRGYSGLTPTHRAVKNSLWVLAGIEMRTQYLPGDDFATEQSGPVCSLLLNRIARRIQMVS